MSGAVSMGVQDWRCRYLDKVWDNIRVENGTMSGLFQFLMG